MLTGIEKVAAFRLVLALGLTNLSISCSATSDWQFPIKLGDSRKHAREVLGDRKSCVDGFPSQTCDSFPNSGVSVEYDGDRVHAITVGGSSGPGIPYESAIVHGVTIRDRLPELERKLGPVTLVDLGPPPRYKWRKPPILIEVAVGTGGEQRDQILCISLSSAAG